MEARQEATVVVVELVEDSGGSRSNCQDMRLTDNRQCLSVAALQSRLFFFCSALPFWEHSRNGRSLAGDLR